MNILRCATVCVLASGSTSGSSSSPPMSYLSSFFFILNEFESRSLTLSSAVFLIDSLMTSTDSNLALRFFFFR